MGLTALDPRPRLSAAVQVRSFPTVCDRNGHASINSTPSVGSRNAVLLERLVWNHVLRVMWDRDNITDAVVSGHVRVLLLRTVDADYRLQCRFAPL